MSAIAILEGKGFHIRRNADGVSVRIYWPDADPKTAFNVLLEPDDRLHLVKDRSATHKHLAEELGR